MVSLKFDIERTSHRPKLISSRYPELVFLVDTGADTPVWCTGEGELLDIFPTARKMKYRFVLSGFGIGVEIADAYIVPDFYLSDGTEEIIFQNMLVAVTNRPTLNVDLILPASLFHHMDLDIDRLSSVMYPTLKVKSINNIVPVFYKRKMLTEEQKSILGVTDDMIVSEIYAEE